MEHELKCWPLYFEPVLMNVKTFEIRRGDRNYQVGDVLYLREFDSEKQDYTGRTCKRRVTYVCGLHALIPGFVGMSIQPMRKNRKMWDETPTGQRPFPQS